MHMRRGPMWSAPPNRFLGHPQQLPTGLEMASQSAQMSPSGPLRDSTSTHVLFYKHLTFQIQSLKICLKMWISDSQVLKFDKFWVLSLKIQSLKRCLMGQTRYEMDYKSNNLLRWMRENKCERQSYKCIHESRVGMPLEILNT